MDTGGGWILRDLRSESLGSVTGVSVQEVILAQRPDEEMKNAAPVSGLPGDAPAAGTCTGPHRTEVAGPISADQQHNAPDATSASSAAVATSTSSCPGLPLQHHHAPNPAHGIAPQSHQVTGSVPGSREWRGQESSQFRRKFRRSGICHRIEDGLSCPEGALPGSPPSPAPGPVRNA